MPHAVVAPSLPSMRLRHLRSLALVLAACAGSFALPSSDAGAAVSRAKAERKALAALGAQRGTAPVIVFRHQAALRRGSTITEAVAGQASRRASRASAGTKALRSAGVRLDVAPVVARAGKEPVWFFYADQAPYQAFEHPGRVALVGRRTGRVTLSRALRWAPLIDGALPAFLADPAAYRAPVHRAFVRAARLEPGATLPTVTRAVAENTSIAVTLPSTLADTPLTRAAQVRAAQMLGADHACVARFSDTLRSMVGDQTPEAFDLLMDAMQRKGGGFHAEAYRLRRSGAAAGTSPARFLNTMLAARGCRDLLIYVAGDGTTSGGAPAVVVGSRPRADGRVEHQTISSADLRAWVAAHPAVMTHLLVDAPRSGAFVAALGVLPNLQLTAASGNADQGAFAALGDVVDAAGRPVPNHFDPEGYLEFTNRAMQGLGCFLSRPEEVEAAAEARAEGRSRSFLGWMLARSLALCGNGYLPAQLTAPALPKLSLAFAAPTDGDVNRPPTAAGASFVASEDTPLPLVLPASDPDGDPLTYEIVEPPVGGRLAGTGASLTYVPRTDITGPDWFAYTVSDGQVTTAPAIVHVDVQPVDDAPVLTPGQLVSTFTEGGIAVAVDPGLGIVDLDSTRLRGASVAISGGFLAGRDRLAVSERGAITSRYEAATGLLLLSGEASVAEYQSALRSVEFSTTGATASASRQLIFRARSETAEGASPARALAIRGNHAVPTLSGGGTTATYTAGDPVGVQIAPGLRIMGEPGPSLGSAEVVIEGGLDPSEDRLLFTPQQGITATFDAATGTLLMTGVATTAQYQAALRSVRYRNEDGVSPSRGRRTVSITVSDVDSDLHSDHVTVAVDIA